MIGFWCAVWCWKLPLAVVRRTLSRGKCRDSCGHNCTDLESRRLWGARCCTFSTGGWDLRLSCRRDKLSRGIVLLHNNARPHTARQTQALLREQFHWDIFEHPPYSPDLAPSCFQKWEKSPILLQPIRCSVWCWKVAPCVIRLPCHVVSAEIAVAIIPYSPDLVPSAFFLFPKMKERLAGKRFVNYDLKDAGWITWRPHGMNRVYTNWCQGTTSALMSKASICKSRQRYVPKLV